MGVINKSKLILGIFILFLAFLLMSHNTFAIIPQGYYNVTSIVYYEDDALTTPITVNTQNLSNTPIVWHNMTGASAYRLSRFRFNLNGAAGLSRTRRILLSFELKVQMQHYAGTEVMGAFFSCPRGAGDLVVSDCAITDLDGETTTWHTESLGNDDSGTYPILSNKNYTIDLVLYNKSDNPVNYNYIDTMSRFILFTNEELTKIAQVSWQIAFNNVAVFSYEQSDTIPYIEGQTEDMNQNFSDLFDKLDEMLENQSDQQQAEQDAVSSIENQSPSDVQGSTSTQTTSIIGVLGSFVSALGNVQATSCNLSLAFPSFMGGTQVVNPCLGKDKAPAIVQAASSMLLILFFLPLSIILLKMIYNEIRSWTSG